jgi:hypothetical protein
MNQSSNTIQSLQAAITAVLSEIAKLPSTDPAWKLLPDFVAQLQAALTANRELLAAQEAEAAEQLAALQAELDKLCSQTSRLLSFFGFQGCETGWLLEELSAEETDSVLASVTALLENLLEYESMEAATDAADTYQAKRDARLAVQEQGDQIAEMVESLQAILPQRDPVVDTKTETAVGEAPAVKDEAVDEEETAVAEENQSLLQTEDDVEPETVVGHMSAVKDEVVDEEETAVAEENQSLLQTENDVESETAVGDVPAVKDEVVDEEETAVAKDNQSLLQTEDDVEPETAVGDVPVTNDEIVDDDETAVAEENQSLLQTEMMLSRKRPLVMYLPSKMR